MQARIAQSESMKQEGRKHQGSQSKTALIRTGRRISALNFIVYFQEQWVIIYKSGSFLWLPKAQKVGVGSWDMDKECHLVLAEIRHLRCVLRELRAARLFSGPALQGGYWQFGCNRVWKLVAEDTDKSPHEAASR